MPRIKLLRDNLINQIAAGEVVERPASVVKELLDNAIDAGAKRIVLEIEEAGMKLIRVSDDGFGMDRDDVKSCVERHATSKIAVEEDLRGIVTMGFRGEALASIASVARLVIESKRKEAVMGNRLKMEGGGEAELGEIGCADGTVVEVRDLFFNTPVRRGFMKSDQVEVQAIVDLLSSVAMVQKEIGFKLIKDGKVVFDLLPTESEKIRIQALMGKNMVDEMVELFYEGAELKVRGWVGKPSLTRSGRNMQYLFVNRRPIKSFMLGYAVKQAFHSLIVKERNPVFVINIEMAPHLVDVNVHPRKSEVRFRNEKEMFRIIEGSVEKALEREVLVPRFMSGEGRNYYQEKKPEGLMQMRLAERVESPVAVGVSGAEVEKENVEDGGRGEENGGIWTPEEIEVIGQLNRSFILCRRGSDLLIVDQHAAHERVRYESLMAQGEVEKHAVQQLIAPVQLELGQSDRQILEGHILYFTEMGFEIEHFGGDTFLVQAVPDFVRESAVEKVLMGVLDDFRAGVARGHFNNQREQMLTYVACRSAVKFGDKLERAEMEELMRSWLRSKRKHTCPHGRPAAVVLEEKELWNRFGRNYQDLLRVDDEIRGINC